MNAISTLSSSTPPHWWNCRPIEVMARSARVASIAIDFRGRRPRLASPRLASRAMGLLRDLAGTTEVAVFAYCAMPDHVHLVLGASASCDVASFVRRFKRGVERAAWERGIHERLWQPSFRGHVVRHDEQLRYVVADVLENPVRRGLVTSWKEYPYAGSLTMHL